MSVDMTPRGTVGCCYYVAKDEKLYFMEDIQCGDVDVIDCRELFLTQHQVFLLTNSQ
jgi:DNA mismatch repair protein MSH5